MSSTSVLIAFSCVQALARPDSCTGRRRQGTPCDKSPEREDCARRGLPADSGEKTIEGFLAELCFGEIGGGKSTSILGATVVDQGAQCGLVAFRQPLDGRALMQ